MSGWDIKSKTIGTIIKNDIELTDYIGINADLRGEVFDFDLNADIDIKTLNPNKFYDAFSLDLNLLRNIYSSSKVEGEVSNKKLCGAVYFNEKSFLNPFFFKYFFIIWNIRCYTIFICINWIINYL